MMNDDLTTPEQINRQSFMEEEKNEEMRRPSERKTDEIVEYRELPSDENAHLDLAAGPRDSSMTMPRKGLEVDRVGNPDSNLKQNSFVDEDNFNSGN